MHTTSQRTQGPALLRFTELLPSAAAAPALLSLAAAVVAPLLLDALVAAGTRRTPLQLSSA